VTFCIREGEILGLAGISNNGQQELADVLAGLRRPAGGRILFRGKDISSTSVLERWQMGIGYIPSDRTDVGSIGEFSLVENVAMNYHFDGAYSGRGTVDHHKMQRLTEQIISDYGVAAPGPQVKARTLSGGNLQKLILARVLSRDPRLVIADLPSQGLDVGATEFVQNKLMEAKKNKAAVLLISEDLDEILSLSDWVAPIYEGRLMGITRGTETSPESAGARMAGLPCQGTGP
jgi:general nucleoside transport system ATP-binding protein